MNYGINYYHRAKGASGRRWQNNNNSNNKSSTILPLSSSLKVGEKLKIVTYNVHGWEDADFRDNFNRVVDVLKGTNADVICLQEVKDESKQFPKGGTLEELALRLGGFDFVKAVAATPDPTQWTSECDVVLSRFPMTNKHTISLLAEPHQDRVAAIAEFSFFVRDEEGNTISSRKIGVVSTHLDHAFEGIRLQQLDKLLGYLEEIDLREYILTGDFNSVWRADFTSLSWQQLTKIRKDNQWEEPRCDVIDKLLNDCGCRDSFWEVERQLFHNRRKLDSREEMFSPIEWTQKPAPTVWANTRIDFILLSRDLAMKPISYNLVNTQASDHFPVTSEMELHPATSSSTSTTTTTTTTATATTTTTTTTTITTMSLLSTSSSTSNSTSTSTSTTSSLDSVAGPPATFPYSCASMNGCPNLFTLLTS